MRMLKCWNTKSNLLLQRHRVAVIILIVILITLWQVKTSCFKSELNPKYLYMQPSEDVIPMHMKKKLKAFEHSENVTLVTAYFQLDTFRKGGNSHINPNVYKKWCSVYSRILNPVVFFTDSPEILSMFKKLRSPSLDNLTKLILVNRTDLWAFSLKPQIAKIFSQADYPKFHPNTVIPDYSCVMHAKYELLKKSIQQNYFHTNFFMWIDFGYFRYEVNKTKKFGLSLPKGFDFRSVAFSLECNFQKIPLKEIIWKDLVWVAGGANLGRYDVLTRFCDDYISSVKRALNQNLMSTDQQIIYAMNVYRNWSSVTLQLCHAGWFCLGYLAKYSWEQHQ